MAEVEEKADPVTFRSLEKDLESGLPDVPSSDEATNLYEESFLVGSLFRRFNNEELEKNFRAEKFAERAGWGRRCLLVFGFGIALLYFLAVRNPANDVKSSSLMLYSIPCLLFFWSASLIVSVFVTDEANHQLLWFMMNFFASVTITVNELAFVDSFSPNLQAAIEANLGPNNSDPISLFYFTEMGWFHTVSLVFVSVLLRPRFPYLFSMTCASFLSYLVGGVIMRDSMCSSCVFSKLSVYLFCCFFNLYSGWTLENAERTAYFLTADLSRKLAVERGKLMKEAEAKTTAERILVSYLCHEIRNRECCIDVETVGQYLITLVSPFLCLPSV
jgi:hypothetical protein